MSWALVPEIQKPVIISSNYLSLVVSSRSGLRQPGALTSHLSSVQNTTADDKCIITIRQTNNLTRFLVIKSDNRQTLVNFTKLIMAAMIKHQS